MSDNNTTPQLPLGDSPTLTLTNPTVQEYLLQSQLNGAEWRGALSLPAYLRREEILAQQDLTQNGGMTSWILVDTAEGKTPLDPPEAQEEAGGSQVRLPLASCDTYLKRALVWRDGVVQEVVSHGVGSVFCAPKLRKRGYAQRLMMEVRKVLETHQTTKKKPCLFTVLYSDIGKKFYNEFGWEPFRSAHVSLPAKVPDHITGLPTARSLYAEDLAELCKIDEDLIRKSLEARPKGSKTAVALIPDVETIRWHQAREEFVGTEILGKAPKVKGAIVGEQGKRVWCYWSRVWYNEDVSQREGNTLYILRLVSEDGGSGHEADKAALLLMAQKEAQEWNMGEVLAWNPTPETVTAAQMLEPEAKEVDRESESITSLHWYPTHEGPARDAVDWVVNEKFGWC